MLAGGRGERLGGEKATAVLDGRPLVEHALAAVRAATGARTAIVAKPGTALPEGLGVEVWYDEDDGFHPRHGIVTALRRAAGEAVLVLAVDLPQAAPAVLALLQAGPTTVTRADGRLQPLCALYDTTTLRTFQAAAADEPLTRTVERLHPTVLDVPAAWLRNVNTPADLRSD